MQPPMPHPAPGPMPTLGPPYSPELINLNQTYNMSGNALTEALLLLSGVYLSLVQSEPGPVDVGLHAIYPKAIGSFVDVMDRKLGQRQKDLTLMKYPAIPAHLNIIPSKSRSRYEPRGLLEALCNDVFPNNAITIFYLNNAEGIQEYDKPTVDYLPRILSSLRLPIIAYDTQFSMRARPPLSVQLAPTMGQLIDVMFSFLKKFNWTDFSFLCTRSKGCLDEIAAIRAKVDNSHRRPVSTVYGTKMFPFNLLSYVNFTSVEDKEEVKDKLIYEMDKDTRIILMHAEEMEAMEILDVAKEIGMTSKDYVWILTSSSIKITDKSIVSRSYPVGTFVIGYDSGHKNMPQVVDRAIDIWLQGLNSLLNSPDLKRMDFRTGFTCKVDSDNKTSPSSLEWPYGDILYKHILKAKLPGDIEFDEFGVLKGNRFWIKNIQLLETRPGIERDSSRSSVVRGSGSPGRSPIGGGGGSPFGGGGRSPFGGGGGSPFGGDRDSGRPTGSSIFEGRDRGSGRPSGSRPSERERGSGRPSSGSSILGRDGNSRRPPPPPRRGGSSSSSLRDRNRNRDRDRNTDGGRLSSGRNLPSRARDGGSDVPRRRPSSNRSSFFSRGTEDDDRSLGLPMAGRYRDSLGGGGGGGGGGGRSRDSMARGPGGLYNGRRTRKTRRSATPRHTAKTIADWDGKNLIVTSITWPGNQSKPPKGKPDKYVLRVATWKEDPHVIYLEPDNTTGECDSQSLPCTVYERDAALNRIGNETREVCCTGLCIDLLKRLSEELHIDVTLFETSDGSYGSPMDKNLTKWSGLMGMLLRNEAELAMAALSITPERSMAVDFSVPFLQTGITIIVAIREGVISPTAFLEPYDYLSWTLILVFSVHATGASIFIFEWLSPYGMDHGKTPLSVHKFSLFRSFWLIWAMLFSASVSTDTPRGCASRFLANIWALFAVVFCASYTANLAAFMITKDDYYDLSGIQDWRLKNPHHRQPPFKFATISESATDTNIKKNYPEIHANMNSSSQRDVKSAIMSLKRLDIQAFIYDSTTLEYEVGKDDRCRLKTVGKRIAETGYGIAFPRRSQWRKKFDSAVLRLQENGEIERIQKFWLAGACHKKKERVGVSSHTLGIPNFTSAFILLGGGIILGAVLLSLEHMYFRFGRKSVKRWDRYGCCSLISLSMGQSLTFEQSVMEAIDFHRQHKCKDPLCETQLWKVKHELDLALIKISQLRKQIAHASSGGGDDLDSMKELPIDGATSALVHENGTAPRRRRQNRKDNDVEKNANKPLLLSDRPYESDEDDGAKDGRTTTTIVDQPERRKSSEAGSDRHSYTNPAMYDGNGSAAENGGSVRPRPRKRSSVSSRQESPREARDGQPEEQRQKRSSSDHEATTPVAQQPHPPPPPPPPTAKPVLANLDLHPPPPSYSDAYSSSPGDMPDGTGPPPSPPLPPPPLPPPLEAGNDLIDLPLPDDSTGAYGSVPSRDSRQYDPVILDSPDLPSSPSFSDHLNNRPSSPGGISKLSNEGISSPDRSSILSDGSASARPYNDKAYSPPRDTRNPFVNNSQTQEPGFRLSDHPSSKTDVVLTSPSREGDNDVDLRHPRSGDHYVNVGDIGKETSF